MLATRCRNESEGFTLVQEVFIGYPTVAQERKVQGKSYPGLLPARVKKLLKVALATDFCGTGIEGLQYRSTTKA